MRSIRAAYVCALTTMLAWLAIGPGLLAQTISATGAASAPTSTPSTGPAKIKLAISKETTYIDGPFNDDGTPDYFEYLRAKVSNGVTKDNNAAAIMFKAISPRDFPDTIRALTLAGLGLDRPAQKGDYLVFAWDYAVDMSGRPEAEKPADLKACLTTRPDSAGEFAQEQVAAAISGPWPAPDHAMIAQWLKANDKALGLFVEASAKPRFYVPMIASPDGPKMIYVMVSSLSWARRAGEALTARAMLRAGEGDIAGASADLLAVHRLGRLFTQEQTATYYLFGLAVDGFACDAEMKLATKGILKADDAAKHLAAIQKLEAFPNPTMVFESDRLSHLEAVMLMHREGARGIRLISMFVAEDKTKPISWWRAYWHFDVSIFLREVNMWDDRQTACLAHDTFAARAKAFAELDAEFATVCKSRDEYNTGALTPEARAAIESPADATALNKALAKVFMASVAGHAGTVSELCDRARQKQDLACIAMAIAAFKADAGKYPAKLDDLSPKYMKQVPTDIFTDKPLVYKLTEKGYILYSLGPNMKDDKGKSMAEAGGSDDWDIVVTAP